MENDIKFVCVKCLKEFNNIKRHIESSHKHEYKNFEEYYDKYLKKPDEGFCHNVNCNTGQIPKLRSASKGYDKYCCVECSQENNPMYDPEIVRKQSESTKETFNDPIKKKEIIQKREDTKEQKYGDKNYNNREKAEQTCMEKHGKTHISQTDEWKEKIKNTSRKKYGKDHFLKSEVVKCKRIKTIKSISNGEFECITQFPEIKKRIQQTKDLNREKINNNIRNGLNNAYEKNGEEINKKRRETNTERYNVEYVMQLQNNKEKARQRFLKTCISRWRNDLKQLDIEILDIGTIDYTKDKIKLKCLKHNLEYHNSIYNLKMGYGGCPKCKSEHMKNSNGEKEILEYVLQLGVDAYKDTTTIINPKTGKNLELDIYIPSNKLAIEFNGIYYHCDDFKDKYYHKNKTDLCLEKDIELIHIFEDEWLDENKKEILKHMIKHKLNLDTSCVVHTRKCIIKSVSHIESKKFLDNFHIMGGNITDSCRLGLFNDDELISLMTFGHGNILRNNLGDKNFWEMTRFCINYNYRVPGAASKLLKFFKNNYSWNNIVTFADKRWSIGNLYIQLGFDRLEDILPNYYYVDVIGKNRIRREKLRKRPDEPKDIPEWILRQKEGFKRIWDCGKIKFIMENS